MAGNSVKRSGESALSRVYNNSRKRVRSVVRSIKSFLDPSKNDTQLEAYLRSTRLGEAITRRQRKRNYAAAMKGVPPDDRSFVSRSRGKGAYRTAKQIAATKNAQKASARKRRLLKVASDPKVLNSQRKRNFARAVSGFRPRGSIAI